MKVRKRGYTAEFKEISVKRVGDELSEGAAAKVLGQVEQTLRDWVGSASGGN